MNNAEKKKSAFLAQCGRFIDWWHTFNLNLLIKYTKIYKILIKLMLNYRLSNAVMIEANLHISVKN